MLGPGSVDVARSASRCACRTPAARSISISTRSCLNGKGEADKARAIAAAKDVGLDMARLEKDLESPEVRRRSRRIQAAEAMGMNGTPSYVIGKQVVIGAVGVEPSRKNRRRALRQGDVLSLDQRSVFRADRLSAPSERRSSSASRRSTPAKRRATRLVVHHDDSTRDTSDHCLRPCDAQHAAQARHGKRPWSVLWPAAGIGRTNGP